jgi:hypothetical protein
MKRILGSIALVGLVASLAANTASAQMYGAPVYFSPAFGTGVGVFGTFATGLNDDAKLFDPTWDQPKGFGGHIILGLSKFQIMGGATYVEAGAPEGIDDKELSFGGNLGLTLFRTPASVLVVNVQAGAGYVKFGDSSSGELKIWNFPIGVGISANVPVVGAFVEPWIAPRVHIFSTSVTGFESETDVGFGVSGGLNANLLLGIGAWAALDWYSVKFGDSTESTTPLTVGGGLSWKFSVPSLGIPGGIVGG